MSNNRRRTSAGTTASSLMAVDRIIAKEKVCTNVTELIVNC